MQTSLGNSQYPSSVKVGNENSSQLSVHLTVVSQKLKQFRNIGAIILET